MLDMYIFKKTGLILALLRKPTIVAAADNNKFEKMKEYVDQCVV